MSNEEYRNRVQNQLQDLVSGNRPRDPHLSSVSTGRLILEGVVEAIRTYRLHKQEQVCKRKGERMSGKERGDGERDGHRNRHHDRKENGERRRHRRHHRDHSGERHRRHRSRDRSYDDTRRRVGTKGRDRISEASGHRHRDHPRGRDLGQARSAREIPDPITEGPPDENPRYMMTGGAGPAGMLPSPDQAPVPPRPRGRSRSRSRPRPPPEDSPPCRPGLSRSPTRTRGPDGTTPFGSLPKRVAGEGFAAHVFKVYRHVKAEHEHGHRERSAIEKAVDGWRERGGTKGRTVEEKKGERWSKERGRGDGERRGRGGDRRRREYAVRHDGHGRSDERSRGLNPRGTEREGTGAPSAQHSHTTHTSQSVHTSDTAPVQIPRPNLSSHPSQETDRRCTPPPPIVRVGTATPPPPSPTLHGNATEWPPSPETFVPHSCSVSPPYPDRPQGSPNIVPMPQSGSVLPPPLPSPTNSTTSSFHMLPPPVPARQAPPSKGALLDQIQTGRRLRRVASADKKDKSQAASAGRVYDETAHSREVEERERAQEGGWSDDGGSETESERMRRLRLELRGVR
ncbi:hypothetical protein BDU57DRAFT_255823 [Ampelomyces quisqualis]|uniref:WH2 domain-containing protein n=1 Tax=Ampelomyces quisqualis TaxID=50730 RepID=A0A6A5QT32_AMPQU|nr:hypothetical protein BDU57DRAFT_255823 [Ampelomyces quisqualis]